MTALTNTNTAAAFEPDRGETTGITARQGVAIWAGLAIPWGALITYLAVTGAYEPNFGEMPNLIAISAILPPFIFLALARFIPAVRQWVATLDAGELTSFQGWRVLGAMFVVLWWFGHLPLVFALFAGLGDFAIGLEAPFVAGRLRRAEAGANRAARWLIVMGLLDFVVAIGTGGLSNPGLMLAPETGVTGLAMTQFPLVLIPAFLVPNFIILHALTWIRLRDTATSLDK